MIVMFAPLCILPLLWLVGLRMIKFGVLSQCGECFVATQPSYGIYISQLVGIGRICDNYDSFCQRNSAITSKLIKQGFWYSKLCLTFKKFARRHREMFLKWVWKGIFVMECVCLYVSCQPWQPMFPLVGVNMNSIVTNCFIIICFWVLRCHVCELFLSLLLVDCTIFILSYVDKLLLYERWVAYMECEVCTYM